MSCYLHTLSFSILLVTKVNATKAWVLFRRKMSIRNVSLRMDNQTFFENINFIAEVVVSFCRYDTFMVYLSFRSHFLSLNFSVFWLIRDTSTHWYKIVMQSSPQGMGKYSKLPTTIPNHKHHILRRLRTDLNINFSWLS